MEIDVENLKSKLLNLDMRAAIKNLSVIYPEIKYSIEYRESDRDKFSVLGFKFNKFTSKLTFVVASDNMIELLPMIYHENEFLRRFLMIFQTFFNQLEYTMSNLDLYFRPTECPKVFLAMLVDWFGLDLKMLQSDEKLIRKILQYLIPLYKIRGTVKGLKLFLYLITGVMPDIIIDNSSSKNYSSKFTEFDIDSTMYTNNELKNVFYVYFSCLESDFSDELKDTIHNVVQSEKPSFMQAFVVFKKPAKQKRKVSTYIDEDIVFTDDSTSKAAGSSASLDDSENSDKLLENSATENGDASKEAVESSKGKKGDEKKAVKKAEKTKKKPEIDDSIMDF